MGRESCRNCRPEGNLLKIPFPEVQGKHYTRDRSQQNDPGQRLPSQPRACSCKKLGVALAKALYAAHSEVNRSDKSKRAVAEQRTEDCMPGYGGVTPDREHEPGEDQWHRAGVWQSQVSPIEDAEPNKNADQSRCGQHIDHVRAIGRYKYVQLIQDSQLLRTIGTAKKD